MLLKANEEFKCSTINDCCWQVFKCESQPMKCYFSLRPPIFQDKKECKVWYIRTDGFIKKSEHNRAWKNTYDGEYLVQEYFGDIASLGEYDVPSKNEKRLLFSRIYRGSINIAFRFLGVFEYESTTYGQLSKPVTKFKKVADLFEF
jgi:hypothetical protein